MGKLQPCFLISLYSTLRPWCSSHTFPQMNTETLIPEIQGKQALFYRLFPLYSRNTRDFSSFMAATVRENPLITS